MITWFFYRCLKKIITLAPNMRPQIVTILTLMLLLFNSSTMLGQTPDGGSGPPPPTGPPPELPLDNGLILLVIAGIALGIYTLAKKYRFRNNLQ